jgi:hypothetical protein
VPSEPKRRLEVISGDTELPGGIGKVNVGTTDLLARVAGVSSNGRGSPTSYYLLSASAEFRPTRIVTYAWNGDLFSDKSIEWKRFPLAGQRDFVLPISIERTTYLSVDGKRVRSKVFTLRFDPAAMRFGDDVKPEDVEWPELDPKQVTILGDAPPPPRIPRVPPPPGPSATPR